MKYDLVCYNCRFFHSVIQKEIAWMREVFLMFLYHISSTDFLIGEDLEATLALIMSDSSNESPESTSMVS